MTDLLSLVDLLGTCDENFQVLPHQRNLLQDELYMYLVRVQLFFHAKVKQLLTLQKEKLPDSTSTGLNDVKFVDIPRRQVVDKLTTNSYSFLRDKAATWTLLIQ